MLFNLKTFLNAVKNYKEDKKYPNNEVLTRNKLMVLKYENCFGLPDDIRDFDWYKLIVSKYKFPKKLNINIPEELLFDVDWEILFQLIAASFSINFFLDLNNTNSCEMNISVSHKSNVEVKRISDLWSFQILRLHEIYVLEQMSLFLICHEDKVSEKLMLSDRKKKLNEFQKLIIGVEKELNSNRLMIELGLDDLLDN